MGSPEEIGVGTLVADTYEVTRLIGQGGMGQVWEAQHRRLPGKRVAVKVLLGQAAVDPNSYARFRREAEIASRLGHPNIVEALDFNTLPGGTPYIILEFLRGESLSKRISGGPMSLDATLAIVRQVASALAASHREGVVHRDLKPDNIYLCPTDSGGHLTDHVKVLDFGISKIKDSNTVQTQASSLIGTPQYMSPEQASGKHAETDHRTDQFALGAIVFEMLTGEAVFAGQSLAEVITKVLFSETPLERLQGKAPEHAIAAIGKALSKNAADRFPDVGAFIGALTGKKLETLDRMQVPSGPEVLPYAPTGAALPIDPFGGTMAPGTGGPMPAVASPQTNRTNNDAFLATAAGTAPVPAVVSQSGVKPLSNPSLAAGEVKVPTLAPGTAAPAPTAPAAGKSSMGLVLGGVGALLGVGAVLFVVLQKPKQVTTEPSKPPVATSPNPTANPTPNPSPTPNPTPNPNPTANPNPNPNPTANPSPNPTANPSPNPSPNPTANPSPNPTPTATSHDPKGTKPAPTVAPKALSPEAESLLKAAESSFAANQPKDALRDAKKSIEISDSPRGRSLIARSACALRDGETPRRQRPKMSAGDWKKVVEFCKKFDVEVQ